MLDVLSYVNAEKAKLKAQVEAMDKPPRIAIIADDKNFAANQSYIRSKTAFALDIGVLCDVIVMKDGDDFPDIEDYSGVIVQYPFRNYNFDAFRFFVSGHVPAEKDIDGLTHYSDYKPCTPLGIYRYLEHLRDEKIIEGNVCVNIVGHGGLVGKPLVEMLLEDKRYTVCVTRSNTDDWVKDNFLASADIVVCATPEENLIKCTNPHKVYVDCGCNLVDGKLLGNVSRDCYSEKMMITPVPNGVGRLTVLCLFENLLDTIY